MVEGGPMKGEVVALPRAPVPLSSASTSSRSNRSFLAGTDAEAADVAAADAAGRLFHTWQFVEQFFVQLLVPLSVLYLVLAHSCSAAANVMSVPRPFSCVFSLIFATAQAISMLPLLVLVAWVLRGPLALDESDAATAVLRMDVTATAAVLIMHRLAIAIKYAFQATAVYGRRMSAWVTYQERLDDQLFASWFKLTGATIEREVGAAVKTLDEDYASASFDMEPEALATLGGMLHEEARADLAKVTSAAAATHATTTSTTTAIPASALASVLLFQVNEMTSGHVLTLQRATSLAGLMSTFSNTLLRAGLGLPIVGSSPLESCIIIGAWVSNFLLLPTIFTFLAVGIVDHARRERALEALSSLLLPTPRGTSSGGSSSSSGSSGSGSGGGGGSTTGGTAGLMTTAVHPPLLPLRSLRDVRAFLAARATLLAFGAGFHSRLVTVISGDLIVLAGVAAYCAFTALTAPTAQGKGAVLAPLVLYHALVFPAIALCALGLLMAARANAAAAASASVVAQVRLHQRVLLASLPPLPPAADAAAAAITAGAGAGVSQAAAPPSPDFLILLEDVERLLRDHAEPVTILGIAATPALTNTLLGGIVSLETLLISGVMTRLNAAATAAAAAGGGGAAAAGAGTGGGVVVPPTATASPTPSPMPESSSSSISSGSLGAIVGYFFAAVTVVAVIAAIIVAVARRRRRRSSSTSSSTSSSSSSSSSGAGGGATGVGVGGGGRYATVSHNPMKVAGEYGNGSSTARTLHPPQASSSSPVKEVLPAAAALMAASSKPPPRQPQLPEGWREHRDDSDVWYENTATGEVTWLHPGGAKEQR